MITDRQAAYYMRHGEQGEKIEKLTHLTDESGPVLNIAKILYIYSKATF